jgi:hypothetical protein
MLALGCLLLQFSPCTAYGDRLLDEQLDSVENCLERSAGEQKNTIGLN